MDQAQRDAEIERLTAECNAALHLMAERRAVWESEYRRLQRAARMDRALTGIVGMALGWLAGPKYPDEKMGAYVAEWMQDDFHVIRAKLLIKMHTARLKELA